MPTWPLPDVWKATAGIATTAVWFMNLTLPSSAVPGATGLVWLG